MTKFRISSAADADLRLIAEYTLKHWGAERRETYIQRIFDAFTQLGETPEISTKLDSVREGYRKFPVGSHVIHPRTSATHSIELIRVLHKRMDPDAHLSSH